MTGTKLPVRASADPSSQYYLQLDEEIVWFHDGLRRNSLIYSYDTELGFVTFYNIITQKRVTLTGTIRVMTISEFEESLERRNRGN